MSADPIRRVGLNAHLLNLSGNYRSAGISWYIFHLLQNLRPTSDLQYTVFLSDPHAAEHFNTLRLARSRLPTHSPIARILWEQTILPIALRRERIDLLHALAFAGPWAITTPWIATIYDLSFLRFAQSFNAANRIYLRWAVRDAARRARLLIAISESTKRDLVQTFRVPADRVRVIYCGKDESFCPSPDPRDVVRWREQHGLPEKMILHVGTLEPRKNAATLVRAFARVKHAAHIPHRLVLIGARGWKYRGVDEAIEQEGIGDQVTFAGYVPQTELPHWYRAADLFVYPSLYEGFGLPPLEAMACGTPVITSNTSSLPEVVGDAALVVNPDDVAMLADAIARVIGDAALREQMRARGLAQSAKFDWTITARETTQIYREILE